MRFLEPSLFWIWLPLVLVPIVLYLFRPRPRTVRTSTLPFFKWLAREHQENAWLRRLKHLLSLILSILVLLAAAAALGRLVVAPSAESLRTVVVLVDRSASMAAESDSGETRLTEAVRRLRHRLNGLSAGVGVVVIAYDRRPEVLLSRSLDPRLVDRALEEIEVRPIEGNVDEALRLARQLAALETPARIWHATDQLPAGSDIESPGNAGSTDDGVAAAGGELTETASDGDGDQPAESAESAERTVAQRSVEVDDVCVALTEPVNVGITAFRLRRLPLERARFEAFVQVHSVGSEPVEANMDVEIDGKLVAPRKLTLQPGVRQRLMIPVDAQRDVDRVLTLRLSAEGDVLGLDNAVHARIPKLQPVRVLWISESPDPFTELALSTLGADDDVQVLQGAPAAWPPEESVDLVIFDGWLPEQWPEDTSVVVIRPPKSAGPVRAVAMQGAGVPLANLRSTGAGHPVLYGVATDRLAVTQTAVIDPEGPLESLWVGAQGPLLLAGEVGENRVVVCGFSPQHSEQLPLTSSYPLLIGNAIYWAAESDIDAARGMNFRTGELVQLQGRELTWESPDGRRRDASVELLEGQSHELDRIGLWRTEAGEIGSAALLVSDESSLPGREAGAREDAQAGSSRWSLLRGDLVPSLLWCLLAILVVESLLFHRSIIY